MCDAERKLAEAENEYGFSKKKMNADQINVLRERHKQYPNRFDFGLSLALALSNEGYGIEDQRLTTKLLASSRRVNGPNNETTKNWERLMDQATRREVHLNSGGHTVQMLAIGYEHGNDGDRVILRKFPKLTLNKDAHTTKDDEGTTVSARANDLTLAPGTPVICHGLVNASHLNGKIGDARTFDCNTKRYEVHFEDASLKPCSVKAINLRILFELPPE